METTKFGALVNITMFKFFTAFSIFTFQKGSHMFLDNLREVVPGPFCPLGFWDLMNSWAIHVVYKQNLWNSMVRGGKIKIMRLSLKPLSEILSPKDSGLTEVDCRSYITFYLVNEPRNTTSLRLLSNILDVQLGKRLYVRSAFSAFSKCS